MTKGDQRVSCEVSLKVFVGSVREALRYHSVHTLNGAHVHVFAFILVWKCFFLKI